MLGAPRILGLSLNWPGTLLLALCGDRVIRLYEVAQPTQDGNDGPAALHSAEAVRAALAGFRVRYAIASLATETASAAASRGLSVAAVPLGQNAHKAA